MPDYSKLVTSFISDKGLVRQHLSSYNYFVSHDIKNIIRANQIVDSDIDPSFYLKYTNVRVGKPTIEENLVSYDIYPHDCRLRDLTYSSFIYVDVEYVRNKTIVVKNNVCIGKIPVMLKSDICHLNYSDNLIRTKKQVEKDWARMKECPLDTGGYFVVKGVERVILIQEQLSKNRILLEIDRDGNFCTSVTSSTHDKKSKTLVINKKGCLYLKNNVFLNDIPIVTAIKSLGITTDKEIAGYFGHEEDILELLAPSMEENAKNGIYTEQQAIKYISENIKPRMESNRIEETRTIMTEVILPNVTCEGTNYRSKGIYIAMMGRRILLAQREEKRNPGIDKNSVADDKDFVGNKRFELAGQLLAIMFEDLFKRYNTELKKSIDKVLSKQSRAQEFDAITFLNLQVNIISMAFIRAISTGNWVVKRFKMEKKGVTQVLSRLSYMSALGMMSRINSQFEKTRKISGPRALHTSQWGVICPSDTPEGESCGLVKNLALLAEITNDCDYEDIKQKLFSLGAISIELITNLYEKNSYLLFLNGMILGSIDNVALFIKNFRNARRKGKIHKFVSIFKNDKLKTVNVSCDGGRVVRPLIVVSKGIDNQEDRGKPLLTEKDIVLLESGYLTFDMLVEDGKVEFLDVNESGDVLIAMNEADIISETTHLEIAPFTILGTVAGLIPFPHHNQSPRNTYQCAMGKQAMGFIGYNHYKRFDTLLYVLTYSQRPMISSKTLDLTNFGKLPAGQNAIIAVMSFSGYDIEDALILNRNSIDRGFGRCEIYKSHTTTLKRYSDGSFDRIVRKTLIKNEDNKQRGVVDFYAAREKCLEDDGIAGPGQRVFDGQVYVNMQSPSGNAGEYKFSGQVYKGKNFSYIDRVILSRSGEDNFMIKTCLRQTRRPEIGDKFSSRHGQKGVVGLIVSQEDMPFSESGITPDIIMNPHGFPSRMTVGKILELVSGKAGLLTGKIREGSAFCDAKTEEIREILVEHGYNYSGKEIFYSGKSGEILKGYIYTGPVYYQKLKHMVSDKIHARPRGPRAMLTRQPTEGRSRDGGLRLGEMERDCLIGYGASSLLIERLLISSDAFDAFVCRECGVIVYKDNCKMCGGQNTASIKLPYACKLLFQELMSMNILPRLFLDEN